MKKYLTILGAATLFTAQAFASYWVVLKDGTRYEATAKPAVTNGRANVRLVSGQVMQVEAAQIDVPKSEEMTRLGGGQLIGEGQPTAAPVAKQQSSLGSAIKLRRPEGTGPSSPQPAAPVVPTGPVLSTDVLDKFERAFENVGIYEHKLVGTGPHSLRAEITADTEEKVFNALSAVAFLIVRHAGMQGVEVNQVDLFMKQTNGGAAGRFQMTREDAQLLDSKQISREDFFVRKVLY